MRRRAGFFDNNSLNPDAYYEPNSFGGPQQDTRYAEPPLPLEGEVNRFDHHNGNDDYTQAGNLFRMFDAGQKQRLCENIATAMREVPERIQLRQIALFSKCDQDYGACVAHALTRGTRSSA